MICMNNNQITNPNNNIVRDYKSRTTEKSKNKIFYMHILNRKKLSTICAYINFLI
jgi:hypothetical protein